MKKKDLKNILKPLIKACIKEVLLEEGVLSNIVSEVVSGMNGAERLNESKKKTPDFSRFSQRDDRPSEKLNKTRKKMLDAIGQDSYNGVNLFEGVEPMRAQTSPGHSPLSEIDPRDPGIDLASIPGMNNWSKLIK